MTSTMVRGCSYLIPVHNKHHMCLFFNIFLVYLFVLYSIFEGRIISSRTGSYLELQEQLFHRKRCLSLPHGQQI